jgi:hypothetical protein
VVLKGCFFIFLYFLISHEGALMKYFIKSLALTTIAIFIASGVYAGKKDPVAVIFQVKGKVEYTKNGKKWKKVRRNKFLFAGYQIRTGPKGSGKITIQKTGKNQELGPNSEIKITAKEAVAVKGSLSNAKKSNKMLAGLMKRFNKSQSYTTVRRSVDKKSIKIDVARRVTLSDDHPEIVWENPGKEYSYKLTVGKKTYKIAAAEGDYIRAKIEPFTGAQKYSVSILKGEKELFTIKNYKSRGKKKDLTMNFLEGANKSDYQKSVAAIEENYGKNSFMLGSYLEKEQMWVAAMDLYAAYLKENPDEIEMTPYLFRVYKKLKLKKIYKKELESYKVALAEE